MYAKDSTPSASISCRNRSSPGRNARQNIAGPMGSPCWTPLEQATVLVSPESIHPEKHERLVLCSSTWPLTA